MNRTTDARTIVKEFREELLADGKSNSTIVSYIGDIESFLSFLQNKNLTFTGQLQRYQITSYRKHLLENNFRPNTINKKINSLQAFNHFLLDQDYMNEQVIDLKKDRVQVARGSEQEVEVYNETELEQILFHIQDQKVACRDRLIVYLLLYTGVRVSELVNIKLQDIDCLAMNLKIVNGKGGKQRDMPLKTEVVAAIKEYLEGERKESKFANSNYLLLTQRAAKMDRDTVNKLLKRLGQELEIEMKPHKFRHTFCTLLLKKGVELTTVSRLAGHSGVDTTARYYINTSREDKANAVALL